MTTSTARYRPVTFGVTRVSLREGAPGVRYLQADLPLGAYARRVTDYLVHWAEATPDHSFVARREQLAVEKIAAAEVKALQDVREQMVDLAIAATRQLIVENMTDSVRARLVTDAVAEIPTRLQ